MRSICLYFHAHQPCRIKNISFFNLGEFPEVEDQPKNEYFLKQVATNAYYPAINQLQQLSDEYQPDFKFSISITGTLLEQLRSFDPVMLKHFQKCLTQNTVEIIAETYYHSFAGFYSLPEFFRQVKAHGKLIEKLFRKKPKTFRNTELAYRSELSKQLVELGFTTAFIEGCSRTSNKACTDFLHKDLTTGLYLIPRNAMVSEMFSKYKRKGKGQVNAIKKLIETIKNTAGDITCLGIDIENFGEYHDRSSGILDFFKIFVEEVISRPDLKFITPSEIVPEKLHVKPVEISKIVTWHGNKKDMSAWNGNMMQKEALRYLYSLEDVITTRGEKSIIDSWRKLQSSDHFLYMASGEKIASRESSSFSPYDGPHEAYLNLMNALLALEIHIQKKTDHKIKSLIPK